MSQRLEAPEALVYRVVIGLYLALAGAMMLQLGLRLGVAQILTTLAPTSALLGIGVACMTALVPVFLWVSALRWLLPAALAADEAAPPVFMHRSLGLVGLLVVAVSLYTIPNLPLSFWAKTCCYLQLLVTVIWSYLCLTCPGDGPNSLWRWLRYPDLEGPQARLGWLVTDLLCYGLFFGLLVYVLCISNVLHLAGWARPDAADGLYQHGLRAGMLLAIWLTPATKGARGVMSVAFLVDWWGDQIVGPWWVPVIQFFLVWIQLAPFHSASEGLNRTLRLGLGLCAGRVLGRVLGALFLGEEGPTLLEPISEVILALWLFPGGHDNE